MGSWDELCIVCGVCPAGGPSDLMHYTLVETETNRIVREIPDIDEDLYPIVKEALESFGPPDGEKGLGYVPAWLPKGMGDGDEKDTYTPNMHIAIGYFDADEGRAPNKNELMPDGTNVRVRQVRQASCGQFDIVVRTKSPYEEEEVACETECTTTAPSLGEPPNANFFTCDRCYYYLMKWLERTELPPPTDARHTGRSPLTFAAEFYEIVHSRNKMRDSLTGLLPCLDYDGIEESLVQWQSDYILCRRGTRHLTCAIKNGLRGRDLQPAILRDCRAWMFMRPDIWPTPPESVTGATHTIHSFPPAQCNLGAPFLNLPNELFFLILRQLPLYSILTLSATCRAFHTLIMSPSFLDDILRAIMTRGSLRWLLPVQHVKDEQRRAFNAIRLWLPQSARPQEIEEPGVLDEDEEGDVNPEEDSDASRSRAPLEIEVPPIAPLFMQSEFPRLAFLRACWESDSMMNRKRLWGMAKQFEQLWRDYRTRGWEVNRFFPSEEIVDKLPIDWPDCVPHDEYI